jgi:two-component system C4-dicarboxylate transport sensor histidine kinase DctB
VSAAVPPGPGELEAQVARLAELGLLTSSLLHEIRQPVFAIQAVAELALVGGGPDAERWRKVLDQVRHLEGLIERFGGLGRPDAEPRRLDPNEPIRAAADMLERRARQVGAELHLVLDPGPLEVHADEAGLRQVVLNLLQNALDAVEGQPERRVDVVTARLGERVSLLVEDSGPGVPHDVLARLFEPFVTSKPVGRGTGLGLYITRVIVHRAGGVVQVASKPGAGTVVRVELPAGA